MYVHSYAVCVLMWWLLLFPASTDVDECVVDNGGCEHGCVNTIGSRLCTCHHGYALNSDGVSCEVTGEILAWFA